MWPCVCYVSQHQNNTHIFIFVHWSNDKMQCAKSAIDSYGSFRCTHINLNLMHFVWLLPILYFHLMLSVVLFKLLNCPTSH